MTAVITDQDILRRLVESEAGKQAAAAIERDYTAERMNLKAQAEKLRRERGMKGRELADKVAATQKQLETARAALTAAEQAARQAAMEQAQTKSHFDARVNKLEQQLRATAPAAISDFLAWLADVEHETQQTAIVERAQATDRISTHTSEIICAHWNNAVSLKERQAACRAARTEVEGLKAKVLDAADLQQRLDELRDSLPAVEMRFSHEA